VYEPTLDWNMTIIPFFLLQILRLSLSPIFLSFQLGIIAKLWLVVASCGCLLVLWLCWQTHDQFALVAIEDPPSRLFRRLPEGVGCKWVFIVKHKADSSVERYNARLVAKGFTQTYGIDYEGAFAPVVMMNSIRVLLSLAENLDWPLQKFDVKNTFHHGDVKEEVYMEIPPGLQDSPVNNKVCKLKKGIIQVKSIS
jgi:hypothetical protein